MTGIAKAREQLKAEIAEIEKEREKLNIGMTGMLTMLKDATEEKDGSVKERLHANNKEEVLANKAKFAIKDYAVVYNRNCDNRIANLKHDLSQLPPEPNMIEKYLAVGFCVNGDIIRGKAYNTYNEAKAELDDMFAHNVAGQRLNTGKVEKRYYAIPETCKPNKSTPKETKVTLSYIGYLGVPGDE